jgi:hypothetical protein
MALRTMKFRSSERLVESGEKNILEAPFMGLLLFL